ncbi:protein STAR1 isoform X1 [Phragmites australis]|uniref:protein STAR1 isoform X1 n=1 Tax=Phragmites australis TaxID=29695 RepID=UPI002D791395|nr:protein STAR1 isoform X1 [Phragmites australis]
MGSASDDLREHLLDVDRPGENGGGAGAAKIRVRGLRRRADATGEEILRGVDLDVPRGLVMGVIGPSGSGKSTLLRALNRLWEPAPGAVLLDGADICSLDVLALRRKVGMLFQLPAMFDGTVADNVRYGPQLLGKKLTEAEVRNLLNLADLDPALSSKPASELSVGQAQRVALARTLANDPEACERTQTLLPPTVFACRPTASDNLLQVLLLDEPTSALDPISTQNIEEAIVRLKKTRGLTTVMVSHSVKQIQRIADLVCLVVDGEIVEVLPPSELSDAKHPMARRFLELS